MLLSLKEIGVSINSNRKIIGSKMKKVFSKLTTIFIIYLCCVCVFFSFFFFWLIFFLVDMSGLLGSANQLSPLKKYMRKY